MSKLQSPPTCREKARRYREMAGAPDMEFFRDDFLALAWEYDQLAELIEARHKK
jgi:hypothetical protein